jgi:hypothetical protein
MRSVRIIMPFRGGGLESGMVTEADHSHRYYISPSRRLRVVEKRPPDRWSRVSESAGSTREVRALLDG